MMLEERSHQIVELCARVTDLSESSQRLQQETEQANRDREESAEQLLTGNQSRARLEVQVEELSEELGVWEQRCYKAEVRPCFLSHIHTLYLFGLSDSLTLFASISKCLVTAL